MPKNRIRFSEDFVLKNNQVGIGTSTPTAKLDVAGDLKVSGIITAPTISIPTFVGVVTIATRSGAATTERMELRTYGVNNGTLAITNARGNLLLSANNIADTDSSEFKINQYLGNIGIITTRTTFAVSVAGTVTVGSALSTMSGITTRSVSLNTFDTINVGTGLTNDYPAGANPFTKANIIRGPLQLLAPFSSSTQFVNLVPRFLDSGALSFEAPVGSARTNRVTQVFSVSNNFTSTIFRINDLNSNPILEASTSGNIGFGTTNPQKRVHIVGAGTSGGLRITSVASTSTEHAEINYYRNIGFTTGIGSTAPGADNTRGALSFEFTGSRFGLSTTSNVQTPLLSLSNSVTDNLFSVAAFTNASFISGISTLPAIDVTLVGDVGIGTTRPQSGFHINKNIIVTAGIASIVSVADTVRVAGIDFYVPLPNRVSYSSSVSTESTQRIYQENITPGIHTNAPPSRRGFYYTGDYVANENSGGQHLSVINDNSSLFTVNNFPAMSSARPAPSGGIRNLATLIDVKSSGNIGFNTTNPVTFIQVGTGTSVISVTGIGSVGIGTTRPTETVDILNGNVRIGINTSNGLILTASNGTKYRIGVNADGTLFTTVVT
jgi:hypothetical protein